MLCQELSDYDALACFNVLLGFSKNVPLYALQTRKRHARRSGGQYRGESPEGAIRAARAARMQAFYSEPSNKRAEASYFG